jgi:hypothetical protein
MGVVAAITFFWPNKPNPAITVEQIPPTSMPTQQTRPLRNFLPQTDPACGSGTGVLLLNANAGNTRAPALETFPSQLQCRRK